MYLTSNYNSKYDSGQPRSDVEMQMSKAMPVRYPPHPIIISEVPQSSRNLNPQKENSKIVFEGYAFEF